VLIVSGDVKPRNQALPGSLEYLEKPPLPVLRITPETADALLERDGLDLEAIREQIEGLVPSTVEGLGDERAWATRELEARVRIDVQLAPPETRTGHNVLGLIRGADAALNDELVIISCHYDGLGQAGDGRLYPGANGNASGVAVMLELARLWHEQEFQPRRSVLFAAWAGGEWPYSGAHAFRDDGIFLSRYDMSAVVHLDRLGGAAGDGLVVGQVGNQEELFELLNASARKLDVEATRGLALRRHYQQVFSGKYTPRNGALVVTWGDPEPALENDTLEAIDPQHLSQAAEVINLTLIEAAHEPRY
jgi:hypothetical protein